MARQPEPGPSYGAILRAAQNNRLTKQVLDGIQYSQDEYLQDILMMSVVTCHIPIVAMKRVDEIESPSHLQLLAQRLKQELER